MTDYWVSSKKHYCEVCRCWLSGSSQNIKKHESSGRHISSLRNKMIESHKKKVEKRRQEEFEAEEMKRLNSITLDNPVPTEESKNLPFVSDMFTYGPLVEPITDFEAEKKRITEAIQRKLAGLDTPEHVELKSKSTKWIATIDQNDGTLIYVNKVSGLITKNKPKDFDGVLPSSYAHLTSNWVLKFDPTKKCRYYHNVDTGEIRWLDDKPVTMEHKPQEKDSSKVVMTQVTESGGRKADIEIRIKKEEDKPPDPSIQIKFTKNVKKEVDECKDKEVKTEPISGKESEEDKTKEYTGPVIGQWEVVDPKDSIFSHCVEDMDAFLDLEEKQKSKDTENYDHLKPEKRITQDSDDLKQVNKPIYRRHSEESLDVETEGPVVFNKRKIPKKN